jgi:hypothetical protein
MEDALLELTQITSANPGIIGQLVLRKLLNVISLLLNNAVRLSHIRSWEQSRQKRSVKQPEVGSPLPLPRFDKNTIGAT